MAIVDGFLFTLTFVTALGCGLIAGLFFAFSVAVMQALARLPAAGGIAAMQSINSAMLNPLFLAIFLGTAAGCAFVMLTALARWHSPGSVYLLVGGALASQSGQRTVEHVLRFSGREICRRGERMHRPGERPTG
jgi:uncharacterized membrane protein